MEQDKKYSAIVIGGTGAVGGQHKKFKPVFSLAHLLLSAGSWLVRFLCRSGRDLLSATSLFHL